MLRVILSLNKVRALLCGADLMLLELRRSAVTAPCILIDTLLQISLEKGGHSMNQMQRTTPPRSALQFIGCTKLP